jgi:hypothetical protein
MMMSHEFLYAYGTGETKRSTKIVEMRDWALGFEEELRKRVCSDHRKYKLTLEKESNLCPYLWLSWEKESNLRPYI